MTTVLHILFVVLAFVTMLAVVMPFGVSFSILMFFLGMLALGEHVYHHALPVEKVVS